MESGEDIHYCIKCNTEIMGLMAYVEHRQSMCTESDNLDGKENDASEKASEVEAGDGGYQMVDEEPVPERKIHDSESSSKESVQPRRGRKRKQGTLKHATGESHFKKSRQQRASNQEGSVHEFVDEVENMQVSREKSGDSPRRSGRRGIRISYTDLLSGLDRTEAKKVGEGSHSGHRLEGHETKVSTTKKGKRGRPPKVTTPKKNESKAGPNVKTKTAAKDLRAVKGKMTLGEKVKLRAADEIKQKMKTKTKVKLPPKRKINLKSKRTGEEGKKSMIDCDEDMSPSEETLTDNMVAAQVDNASVVYIKDGKFYCQVCQTYCSSKKKMDVHCNTRKHLKNVEHGLPDDENEEHANLTIQDSEEVPELFHCYDCSYATKNKGLFDRHMDSISHAQRSNITLFPCKYCHRKFKTEEELESHQEYHSTPRCMTCKGTFETEELLENHLQETNHSIEHRCPECDKTFSSKGNLNTHMQKHDPNCVIQCDMCDYSTTQVALMKRHKQRHLGIMPFKCGFCDFESNSKHIIERHMKTHLNRSRDFKCDECGSGFFDKNLLKQHKYMKHSSERRFPCDFEGCTFAFKYRSSLLTHQRMHTQEKPFLCAECGYAASTKYSLTKHIRLHTGEKPFKCNFPNCKYTCRLSTHLSRHKIIHTGAKPFQCPFCSYACNNKQNLRKHLLTTKSHEGLKMYKCKTCPDYSTNNFREYVIHIRTEHADEDKYISYFEIAESVNKKAENMARALQSKESEETVAVEEIENDMRSDDDGLNTFSVMTVVPGKEGSRRLRNVTIMDDRAEVQKKLEQVILALEDTTSEVEVNHTEGEGSMDSTSPQVKKSGAIQVNNLGELVSLATKELALGEEPETIYIVPDVQTETEISTSSETVEAVAIAADEAAMEVVGETIEGENAAEGEEPIQQIVVEFDQQGRLVSEEEMAAATWLHNMGNIQGVTVEAIIQEEPAAEEVHE